MSLERASSKGDSRVRLLPRSAGVRAVAALLFAFASALAHGVPTPPTANDDIVVFDAGGSGNVTIELLANDADGDTGTPLFAPLASHLCQLGGGNLLPVVGPFGSVDGAGSPAALDSGRVRLSRDAGFAGESAISYVIDSEPGTFPIGCVENPSNKGALFFVANRSPQLDVTELTIDRLDGPVTIDLEDYWSDPDEGLTVFPDSLSYAFNGSTDGTVFTATLSGSSLTITPTGSGVAFADITATDNRASIPGAIFRGTDNTSTNDALRIVVNDPPTALGIANDTRAEDSPAFDIDLTLAFSDDFDASADLVYTVGTVTNGSLYTNVAIVTGTTLRITPAADQNGSSDITVRATDSRGEFVETTFQQTLTAVNDPPFVDGGIANQSVGEDAGSQTISIASAFDDVDLTREGDTLTLGATPTIITSSGSLTFATLSVNNATQELTYESDLHTNGTATIEVSVTDAGGLSATTQFDIEVTAIDDAPQPVDDVVATLEEVSLLIDVLANDGEVDSEALTIVPGSVTVPSNGTAVIEGTQIRYTPDPDFFGPDSFDYQVTDGITPVAATVDVTVTPVDDAPGPQDDTALVIEDGSVSIFVLVNDEEVDGEALSIASVSDPPNGTAVIVGTRIDYSPDLNFNGVDTFTYQAFDGITAVAATVTVTVTDANDPPFVDQGIADVIITEDAALQTIDVSNAFDDPDIVLNGDSLTLSIVGNDEPTKFDVLEIVGTQLRFQPAPDHFGVANVTAQAEDALGFTVTTDFQIQIDNRDDTPRPFDDAVTIAEGGAVTSFDPRLNDFDDDFVSGGNSSPGALRIINATAPVGTVTIAADDQSIDFTPPENFYGTVNVSYEVIDGFQTSTASADIVVTVTPVDDAPDAVDDVATTDEDIAIVIDPLVNDTEMDSVGDDLARNPAAGGVLQIVSASVDPAEGGVTNDGTTITYTPAPNFNGTAIIDYAVVDSDGPLSLQGNAQITVTVNPINDAPTVVTPIPPQTLVEDQPLATVVDLSGVFTDIDFGDTTPSRLALTIVNNSNPALFATATTTGTVGQIDGASLELLPDTNRYGSATLTIRATDDGNPLPALVVETTVDVTVTAVDDAPDAVDDVATTDEDNAIVIDPLVNDTEVDSVADGLPRTPAVGGVLQIVSASVDPAEGVVVNNGISITYTPAANFNGTAVIDYSVVDSDGPGSLEGNAQITVTVNPVNDVPTVVTPIPPQTLVEDQPLATVVDLSGVFTDIDFGDTTPSRLALTIVNNSNPALFATATTTGTVGQIDGASLELLPDTNRYGSATLTIRATDNGNPLPALFVETTVDVTVDPVDDAPLAVDDTATTDEDNAIVIDPRVNDTEVDSVGDGLPRTPAVGGVLQIVSASVDPAEGIVTNNGTNITYTPAPNFNGTAVIDYAVVDSDGPGSLEGNAQITVTVNPVNDVPTVVTPIPPQTLTEDQPLATVVDLSGVFTDIDFGDSTPSRLALTIVNNTNPDLFATATTTSTVGQIDGASLELLPDANRFGSATLTIRATDNGNPLPALFVETTVDVTIDPVDDAPVANDDAETIPEDTVLAGFDPFVNDTEVDSTGVPESPGALSIQSATVDFGTVTVTGGNTTLDYTPPLHFFGTATISYVVEDGFGTLTDTADVVVTVTQVDDAPTAVDDVATMDEDTFLTFDPTANDSEVDSTGNVETPGTVRIVAASVDPAQGTVVISGGGSTVDFTPALHFFGVATIDYTIEDSVGVLQDFGQIAVTVDNVDDPPNSFVGAPPGLGDDAITVVEDNSITFPALANDLQVDGPPGAPMSITSVGVNFPPANGVVSTDGTNITYTPDPDYYGFDTFSYTVRDNFGTADHVATVVVDVTPVDDAPRPVDDVETIPEDTTLTGFAPLVNDVEVDSVAAAQTPGTIFIVDATVPASQGTVSVAADGLTIDYAPPADFFGTAVISYEVDDGFGTFTATATITVTVTQVDDAPRPQDDVAATNEDTPLLGFDPRTNDIEVDTTGAPQSPGTITIVSASVDQGTVVVSGGGTTIDYTPDPNFFGTAIVVYEVQDAIGPATATAQIEISVAEVNDSPIAVSDVYTVTEDDLEVVLPVTDNDFLFDAPVTITIAGTTQEIDGVFFFGSTETTPTTIINQTGDPETLPNGSVFIADGSIIYTPKPDYNGTDFFTYTLEDVDGDVATGRVDITITAVNDAPTGAAFQTFSMVEDTSLSIGAASGLRVGAFDADGDAIQVVLQTPPGNGTVVLNPDGSFTYTPTIGFVGVDSFDYFLTDGTVVNDGDPYVVEIDVQEEVVDVTPPPSGTVEDLLPISQLPLELVEGVDPNVLIIMDDSGSMDFQLATSDQGGEFTISSFIRDPLPRQPFSSRFEYLYPLFANTYNRPPLPSEATIQRYSVFRDSPYGVWRARTHFYNQIYYNPETRYRPWRGLAPDGASFPEADPLDAWLNPMRQADRQINLRTPIDYRSRPIAGWDRNGRAYSAPVDDYYIPRYYRLTGADFDGSEPAWDEPHCLVEIRPTGEAYTALDISVGVPVCETVSSGVYPGGVDRTDCANPASCTYEEELQNFANWFVYYRSREYTVKASLGRVVSDNTGLNIGYAAINRISERTRIRPMEASFRDPNKSALLQQIYQINSNGATPLRSALDRAGKHFACLPGDSFASGGNSAPGSAKCPVAAAPAGNCQQNFALLFTDGVWNQGFRGAGNEDADDPISETSSAFDGGFFADDQEDTLADIAMFYYESDLHDTLDDLVPTRERDRALAPDGALADPDVIHQHMSTFTVGFGVNGFFNDDDIPTSIASGPASIDWPNPSVNELAKIDDLRHAALNGRGDYLSAADPTTLERELRAAFEEFAAGAGAASAVAFNSQQIRTDTRVFRGFYNTDDNTGDLIAQLIDFETNTVVEEPVFSAAELLDQRTADSRVIVTFDPTTRRGIPFRHAELNPLQQAVITADQVDYLRGVRDLERPLGDFRERPGLSGLLGDVINSAPVFVGGPSFSRRDRLEFPTADGDLYSSFQNAFASRPGVVYVGANDGMLHAFDAESGVERFAFLPDRMLRTGEGDANAVTELTEPLYEHFFYVDGQPAVGDVFIDPAGGISRQWRSVLIGTYRAGGKGLFALDVTNPAAVTNEAAAAATVLWEFTDDDDTYPVVPSTAASDVVGTPVGGSVGAEVDPSGRPVKDLGYTFSVPTIAMTSIQGAGGTTANPEHKWAAVFGNGYNSTYGFATLYVLLIENGADGSWDAGDVIKIRTGFGPAPTGEPNPGLPNGLGEPRLIDLNGDGVADYAYAGDLRGNLFRFDLTDPNPNNWTSARIFRATHTDPATGDVIPQPITTQPIISRNTQTGEGVIVTFGTGSYFTDLDGTDENIQSLYGIWDRIILDPSSATGFAAEGSNPVSAGDRSLLVEQTLINLFDETQGALRTLTSNEVVYVPSTTVDASGTTIPAVRGWYIDFDPPKPTSTVQGNLNPDPAGDPPPGPQFPGERPIRNLILRGGFLFVNTVIPRDNLSCDLAPGGFGLALNPLTGGLGGINSQTAFDINNDGNFDESDLSGGNVVAGLRFDDAVPTDSTFIGTKQFTQLSDRTLDIRDTNTGFGARTGRLSWRELE